MLTRALLIDQLAGPSASKERRDILTAQVDAYLEATLVSAITLNQVSAK